MSDSVTLDNVSMHAVTRFCQRILDVPAMAGFATAKEEAKAHCRAAGLSVDKVKSMILTDKVKAEIALGRFHIKEAMFWAVVRDRMVATIKPLEWSQFADRRRCVIRSKRELRKGTQRNARRLG